MSEQTKKVEMRPIKTIRQGAIAASIWKRQAPSGFEYFDFSLSRSWKTKNTGKEGYSNNFFSDNGEQLAEVIRETADWQLGVPRRWSRMVRREGTTVASAIGSEESEVYNGGC